MGKLLAALLSQEPGEGKRPEPRNEPRAA
jgi:hypothetical protein